MYYIEKRWNFVEAKKPVILIKQRNCLISSYNQWNLKSVKS